MKSALFFCLIFSGSADAFYTISQIATQWTRSLGAHHFLKKISSAKLSQLHSELKTGDLLLQREEGRLSNVFIPGYFTHVALVINLQDTPHIQDHPLFPKDSVKSELLLMEATPPKVRLFELEKSKSSFLMAFRPQWPSPKLRDFTLKTGLSALGLPYDFFYDAKDPALLTCSEFIRELLPWLDIPVQSTLLGTSNYSPDVFATPTPILRPILALHHDPLQKPVHFHQKRITPRLQARTHVRKSSLQPLQIVAQLHQRFKLWRSVR